MENPIEVKKSNKLKIALIVIGEILLLFSVFSCGMAVGLKKDRFSHKFADNYERNFIGREKNDKHLGSMPAPLPKFMDDFSGRDFRNAHGIAGTIFSISDSTLIVLDRDNKENTVLVTEKTLIKSQRDDLSRSDLKTGDEIVVMGSPDENGVVSASLIRVFNPNNITK
ncbi:MAG: hypothetical protein A2271_01155 [Candidatus Moranbacteria bacterium RIFOXYA12_FULL_35_19]|nr:MAG: hypothetical protein UR78_C0005G0009 [Candidatus Moranbacteria bacterium GW2011_GWF2_35_39]OGI30648.1 MAG: hypothetical protein A2343_03635 [Candidatus Moranbacteria bacterium RIFOXYB12_FULL_35_8]OGI33240.1 MAG: hypothetical protein A2489_01060 [Candidatus Moranbacteria bacterium RIFOXYC12_FULL_36_13]OGI36505.1 MAG: hypothetical protein A2271_01155 [Candidatus Moranbacteria bacterium RIFOXYA12_FULL_35_19]